MPPTEPYPRESKEHLQAVQALFVKHSRDLRFFVLSLLPGSNEIDDILQEVFLVVTKKAHQFELGTNFIAWSFRITRLEVLRQLRQAKKRPITLEEDVFELLASEAEDTLSKDGMLETLSTCVGKLSGRMREFIVLRYEQGLKSNQIAETYGWSPNAVYVTLSRARLSIRKCMERELRRQDSPPTPVR